MDKIYLNDDKGNVIIETDITNFHIYCQDLQPKMLEFKTTFDMPNLNVYSVTIVSTNLLETIILGKIITHENDKFVYCIKNTNIEFKVLNIKAVYNDEISILPNLIKHINITNMKSKFSILFERFDNLNEHQIKSLTIEMKNDVVYKIILRTADISDSSIVSTNFKITKQ